MLRFLLFLLLSLPFWGTKPAQAQTVPAVRNIPGKIVYKLKPQYKAAAANGMAKPEKLEAALAAIQASAVVQKFPKSAAPEGVKNAVDLTLVYQANIPTSASPEKACADLLKTGMLEYAEPLRAFAPLYQPNDPYADSAAANNQYYLKRIKAYKGWDLEKGDTSIVIGISDSGIRYTHKDLGRNIKFNYADPIDGLDNDNDGFTDNFRGWDFADNDNDATFAFGHGTEVAGVASALANNARGTAGIGFNCKFLPLKVYATNLTGAFGGYESIVYGADHGCSVINLSWGGYAPPSAYEQDVVNYAVINKNVVMVAAAGNTHGKLDFVPASYKNMISVAFLNSNNVIHNATTHSYQVDLVAPGIGILTTTIASDSAYLNGSGSSLASPMVAATAGLVKKKFPQFNAEQIAEQIRVTSDPSIYTIAGNTNFADMLGHGILDVAKALSTTNAKSVRFTRVQTNKPQFAGSGDTIQLAVDFKNYLQPLANLAVTITTPSPYVTITQASANPGAMGTLATTTNIPFKVYVNPTIPVNEKVALKFNFSDGTYTDYQFFEMVLNPDFVTIDVNQLEVTVTSKGNIGFQEFNPDLGKGVRFRKQNLLSEAGLLVGNSPTAVSDNVRNATFDPDNDFFSQARVHFINSVKADMEAEGIMKDSFPVSGMVGVGVNYRAYAWQQTPKDKFVILEYSIQNLRTDTLTNLYAGMFADWDIFDSGKNVAGWHSATKTGYIYNLRNDSIYAGIKLLTPGNVSFYALDNATPPPGTINISDGFTDAEKYQALSGGLARLSAGSPIFGNDVSYVIGSKLPDLPPTQSVVIAFAILAGTDLPDLTATAQSAQTAFNQVLLGRKEEVATNNLLIFPNPANSVLNVKLPAGNNTSATLELLDITGRTLVTKSGKGGETVAFNVEKLAAGMYFMRTKTQQGETIRKVLVVK